MGVVVSCIISSFCDSVAKISHYNHAKAWQLIVNELSSNAKALILLGFLKKTMHTYAQTRILQVQTRIFTRKHTHLLAYGRVPPPGVCVVCMNKYTDGYFQLLTTLVTDKNNRY